MKKLSLLLALTVTMLSASDEIQNNIAQKKAQVDELNKEIKTLESQLPKDPNPFHLHAAAGYSLNSGNTNTEAFNGDAKISQAINKNLFELTALMQYSKEDGKETKNRISGELIYSRALDDKTSLNYLAGYKDDKFSGYDYQFYTGPGAKYQFIKDEVQSFSMDANLLYAQDAISDTYHDSLGNIVDYPYPAGSINQHDGHTDSYASYRLQGVYDLQLRENVKFAQLLNYRSELGDTKNYFIFSKSTLSAKISDVFSVALNYYVDYANKPAADKTSTDKILAFSLVADF